MWWKLWNICAECFDRRNKQLINRFPIWILKFWIRLPLLLSTSIWIFFVPEFLLNTKKNIFEEWSRRSFEIYLWHLLIFATFLPHDHFLMKRRIFLSTCSTFICVCRLANIRSIKRHNKLRLFNQLRMSLSIYDSNRLWIFMKQQQERQRWWWRRRSKLIH